MRRITKMTEQFTKMREFSQMSEGIVNHGQDSTKMREQILKTRGQNESWPQ